MLILACCSFELTQAQHIVWANKNNLDRRTDFTKVIGQNKNGIYVLKHKNSTFRRYFILEHFDTKMNLLKSKTFKMPGGELEKIIVTESNVVFFSKIFGKGFSYKLQMQRIDSSMNESNPVVIVNSADIGHEIVDFKIEFNQKRDRFMIWYLLETFDSTVLKFHLCNLKGLMKSGQTSLRFNFSEIYIGDDLIDDSGNIYLIYTRSEKFRSKNPKDFFHYFYGYNIQTGQSFNSLINNDETFINSYKISYNYEKNVINVFGLYGKEDEDENSGFFNLSANPKNMEIDLVEFKEFDRKIISSILGFKNEQKGENLSKFKIKKIVPKADGGNILIAERTYITTQSEVFYVNGIPQSTYARIFNSDEVLIFNLDSNGIILWSDIIFKNQSTTNDGGYYNGIVVMVSDDMINILYNDKLNANADIIQVTYSEKGRQSKKILLNNDQYYALVIPAESNQVTSNSIVIPINQNREFTYIKLLY
ncbi:MAG: hypothetical protein IT245_04960 [Bacteroidia bacterium]|nr:hypothetical protein [Bacteroidia bacterium]